MCTEHEARVCVKRELTNDIQKNVFDHGLFRVGINAKFYDI
jgi:hypothetical protein